MPVEPATWMIVAIVVVIVLVLAAVVLAIRKRRRRSHLQERFGPEYSRTVERSDSRRSAESDLAERERERDERMVRPLTPEQRQRLVNEWDQVQLHFVDAPPLALERGDGVIREVLRERGYDDHHDLEQRAAMISVDYPHLVERYRDAHRRSARRDGQEPTTEDRREALLALRDMFDALIEGPPTRQRSAHRDDAEAPPGSRPGDPMPPPPPEPAEPPREHA